MPQDEFVDRGLRHMAAESNLEQARILVQTARFEMDPLGGLRAERSDLDRQLEAIDTALGISIDFLEFDK